MKQLEGKEVWLEPTGNNARRTGRSEPVKALVVKVSRVFVTLKIGDHDREEKLRVCEWDKMHLEDDHNGGYHVHESKQAYLDSIEVERLGGLITRQYTYSKGFRSIGVDAMRKVAELLEIDTTGK